MKKTIAILTLGLLAAAGYAETDSKALAAIDDIRKGNRGPHEILTLRVIDDAILPTGSIETGEIEDGTLVNADVNSAAGIDYSKLDIGANIASSNIADQTIVNDDISGSAAIASSKLATSVPVSPTGYAGRVKIQFGSVPTNAADARVITYSDVFSAAPAVMVQPESASTNTWYPSSVNRTNFTVNGEAAIAGGYIAVGLE